MTRDTGGYIGFQGVKVVAEVTGGYRRLQGVKRGVQGVRRDYRGLKWVAGVKAELHGGFKGRW